MARYASGTDAAIRKMEREAKSNGWSVALIVCTAKKSGAR
jgi:hypothetical protein